MAITGNFGRLTVISDTGSGKFVMCRCSCGQTKSIRRYSLTSGNTKSCGCLLRDVSATHGHTRPTVERKSGEYSSWDHMIQRCTNSRNKYFVNYGGRGIKVCERWRDSFEAFLEDMGSKPSPKHSIDRIDNDGNYEPGNCRWATRAEQMLNQRVTVHVDWGGEKIPLASLARSFGACPKVVDARLRKGWELNRALMTPVDKTRSRTGPRRSRQEALQ